MSGLLYISLYATSGADNITTALRLLQNDRICELGLWDVTSSQLEKVAAVMREPFPVLTSLPRHHRSSPIRSWTDLRRVYDRFT